MKAGRKLPGRAAYLIAAVLMLVSFGSAGAATGSQGPANGLRVSPLRSDLTIAPGHSQTVVIDVTNITAAPATLQAVFNDFTASSDESGAPAISLDDTKKISHGLKQFMKPVPNFTLQPGQQAPVRVTVSIPNGTTAGGYFGVVRFAPASLTGQRNINLAASVGSLILVKVPGNLTEQLKLVSLDVRSGDHPHVLFFSGKNLTATARFQNTGNVQEEPFGKVLLKNHSGKILGTFEVNDAQPRGNVLPDSIRKFSVPLKGLGSVGSYTVEANFGYGQSGLLSGKTTFYIIPLSLILIVIGVIALILFLIFGLPRLIHAYNQRIIRSASRRR